MHIISRSKLREFWEIHPHSQEPLIVWHRLLENGRYADFNALRRTFGAADYVALFTIFDIGGNKFRIITVIHYNRRRVYVRYVFTHSEYDRWSNRVRKTGNNAS